MPRKEGTCYTTISNLGLKKKFSSVVAILSTYPAKLPSFCVHLLCPSSKGSREEETCLFIHATRLLAQSTTQCTTGTSESHVIFGKPYTTIQLFISHFPTTALRGQDPYASSCSIVNRRKPLGTRKPPNEPGITDVAAHPATNGCTLGLISLRRSIGVKGRPEPLKQPSEGQGWSRARAQKPLLLNPLLLQGSCRESNNQQLCISAETQTGQAQVEEWKRTVFLASSNPEVASACQDGHGPRTCRLQAPCTHHLCTCPSGVLKD